MITTTLFPGRYVQGRDVLRKLGRELGRFGRNAFLIADGYVLEHILPDAKPDIERDTHFTVERFGGECSDEEIERLAGIARGLGADAVAGIGGGKTLDTAKALAHSLGAPVASVPTIASTDAPCSALAVIYHSDGTFKRYLPLPRNPDLVLVDTAVIAGAPVRLLVSGMGDALATHFEAESCRLSEAPNMSGNPGSMTAYALAQLCYDTLLEYGVIAKHSGNAHVVTPALEHIVEANTLLSGLGFESGGLAAAHSIHNGFTVHPATHDFHHGEKVAFGTLASLVLTDKPQDVIDEVYGFCEAVGLPTTLAGIGLAEYGETDLMRIADAACAKGETIHNEPLPVTPHDVAAALKAADAIGKERIERAGRIPAEFSAEPAYAER